MRIASCIRTFENGLSCHMYHGCMCLTTRDSHSTSIMIQEFYNYTNNAFLIQEHIYEMTPQDDINTTGPDILQTAMWFCYYVSWKYLMKIISINLTKYLFSDSGVYCAILIL